MEIISKSIQETKGLAKTFGESLKGGEIILLYGDLGSGKTTFVQGLAKGLGVEGPILSPTFVLRRSYKGNKILNHYDFYRLDSEKDLIALDLDEDINSRTVTVIEWPDKVGFMRKGSRKIHFRDGGDDERVIKIEDIA
jgi:tRNA threonylcarbamoyladenosine biosynthesis protein TsaE